MSVTIAMELALALEKLTNEKLLQLHAVGMSLFRTFRGFITLPLLF